MDYISREAALESLCIACEYVPIDEKENCPYKFTGCQEYANIFAIPAADVRPVVRGKWEKTASNLYDICPICREPFSNRDILGVTQNKNFCPNCGAQMEVEHD